MTDFIKEAFQVNIYDVVITVVDIFQRLSDSLMGIAIGTKTVTMATEVPLKNRTELLVQGLM